MALLPVVEDITGARATACVQPSRSGRDQLLQAIHQVLIAPERRVGGFDVHGLDEIMAYLGVTPGVLPIKGLRIIQVLTHCRNSSELTVDYQITKRANPRHP